MGFTSPFNKDSGRYKGKRFIQGGRSMIRKSLYMSALSSVRSNPDMKFFIQDYVMQESQLKSSCSGYEKITYFIKQHYKKANYMENK